MAEFDAQRVPDALLFGAAKGKAGMLIKKPCAALPVVPVQTIPPEWAPWEGWTMYGNGIAGQQYTGALLAQFALARGVVPTYFAGEVFAGIKGGAALFENCWLISTGGKVFDFASQSSLDMWASINKARILRELELAAGMTPEKRAVWAAAKRERLAKYSARVLAAAAKVSDVRRQAALIAESEFAAAKWGAF